MREVLCYLLNAKTSSTYLGKLVVFWYVTTPYSPRVPCLPSDVELSSPELSEG